MCGIVGARGQAFTPQIQEAVGCLHHRGPNAQQCEDLGDWAFGHARLSIIDTTTAANQPMQAGSLTLVFNGEIYNYRQLKKDLEQKGHTFTTTSDTEVLLHAYAEWGKNALERLHGFFAFAIYDAYDKSVFLARDRMGIKPLYYYNGEDGFAFGSELQALMALGVPKVLDHDSLYHYFMLNYIPEPYSVFQKVCKLEPGHYLHISATGEITKEAYYQIPLNKPYSFTDYDKAKAECYRLLEQSVQERMVADVPLGAFLSGGIDSSITAGLAARHTQHLHTFSIGFADNPYFDETEYARIAAKKFDTEHTVFKLTNQQLFEHLDGVLQAITEPFADSSALPVYILSKETRQRVTVALSGDGADELFGGYNKHMAAYRSRNQGLLEKMVLLGHPLWKALPKSRNGKWSNRFRQLERFAAGAKMNPSERWWRWCAFSDESYPNSLLKTSSQNQAFERKAKFLQDFEAFGDLNDVFYADTRFVLVNDMLVKADRMSMANSLEVRVPFLDHRLVDFAFSIPPHFKVDGKLRKRILKDAFRDLLPHEIYHRGKMGFEVPLLDWFRTDLRSLITDDLLADDFVMAQDLFHLETIRGLKQKLFSADPGEVHAQIWALIVFQTWWKKYITDA